MTKKTHRKGASAPPASGRDWYRIHARGGPRALADNEAEIDIFGDIGEDWFAEESNTAKRLIDDLRALGDGVEYLTVRLNSYGGSVSDGLAIYNALKRHPAAVTVTVEGVAVSIASLIAMAGDTVMMPANTLMMIHAPWSFAVGNARDMREHADVLDTYAEAMASSYAAKTGRPIAEMLELLQDGEDHWYTAAEAVEEGFADTMVQEIASAASLRMDRFHVPAAVAADHPAAPAASSREDDPMAEKDKAKAPQADGNTPEPQGTTNVTEIEKAAEARLRDQIQARNKDIEARFKPFLGRDGVSALYHEVLGDTQITADQAGQKLLAKLAEGAEPLNPQGYAPRIEVGQSAREKFGVAARAALLARAGIQKDDGGNQFRGYTLVELARASLREAGVSTEWHDKLGLVAAAFTHTSSDFPALLENIAQKAMLKGYEEAQETFQRWTTAGTLPDFKPAARTDINVFPSLLEVPDGAEYKSGTIGDRGEKIQLATYGKMFSITRQTVINDDLDAFTRIPMKMGRAAIRTIGNLVYAILNDNPTMADGVALFHADHNNLLTGAQPNTASVDAMRVAMARQTLNGVTLNIRPFYFVVPVEIEGATRVVMNSEFEVGASAKNNTVPNSVRGIAEVISDARLTGGANPAWYGVANPAMHDTVEVAYLDGNDQPTLEQQDGWKVDGTEFKVRIDAGVKALDFRTMAKNPGS